MAQLNGNVSPLWLTIILELSNAPPLKAVQAAVRNLIRETKCLNVVWIQDQCRWGCYEWSNKDMGKVVRTKIYEKKSDITEEILNTPVDITKEPPIRIWLASSAVPSESSSPILALQVHHAFCDGRALFTITRQFGQHLESIVTGKEINIPPLEKTRFINSEMLSYILQHWKKWGALFSSAHYQFARRAIALKKSGSQIESSLIRTIRLPLTPKLAEKSHDCSALIFESILAAIYAHGFDPLTKGKLIRLRVPVDLRPSLKIPQNIIGNLCSAVPVEIPLLALGEFSNKGNLMLGKGIIEQIKNLVSKGAHLTTLLECLLIPYFTSTRSLRENVRKEFLASTRTSTLVISTGGKVDRYLKPLEIFGLRNLQLHSGTWGIIGCIYQNAFFITTSCFKNIWTRADIDNFSANMLDFCEKKYGIQGAII
jgi:NRPS condensation-like uncharacterized protein